MHQNAIIRIPLLTPLVFPMNQQFRRMLFDSLVAGILIRRGMDWQEVESMLYDIISFIQLGNHRLACASQVIFEGPVQERQITAQVSDTMRHFREHELHTIIDIRPTTGDKAIRNKLAKSPFSYFEEISVPAIYYFFRGNVGSVLQILKTIRAIGPMTGGTEIDVDNIDCEIMRESHLFGLIGNKHVLRPIPERFLDQLALSKAGLVCRTSFETWFPLYYDSAGRELCLVPADNEFVVTPDELQDLL